MRKGVSLQQGRHNSKKTEHTAFAMCSVLKLSKGMGFYSAVTFASVGFRDV